MLYCPRTCIIIKDKIVPNPIFSAKEITIILENGIKRYTTNKTTATNSGTIICLITPKSELFRTLEYNIEKDIDRKSVV